MGNEWVERNVEEVANVFGGGTPSTKDEANFNGEIPWITPKDLSGYPFRYISRGERNISKKGLNCSNAKLLPVGTVLLTTRAPVGYVAIAANPVTTNQGFHSLVPHNGYSSEFIYYLLKANAEYLKSNASGTTFGELSGSTLKRLKFVFPSIPEQRAIADVLGSLDDKIELNHHINATLESMARAVFKAWFVENEEAKGWEVRPLDEIADYLNGLALQKYPPESNEFLPVIKIAQLRKNNTDDADRASANLDPAYIVDDGDVLFSWSGSLEVVIWCGGKGALNQHLFKVTSEEYPKWFYYLWTKYHLADFQQIAAGKATTMGHIQRHHLSQVSVIVPPPEIFTKMTEQMEPLIDLYINSAVQSRTLAALRDALLPRLMSGEVRVGEG